MSPKNFKHERPQNRIKGPNNVQLKENCTGLSMMDRPNGTLHQHEVVQNQTYMDEGTFVYINQLISCEQFGKKSSQSYALSLWAENLVCPKLHLF